MVFGVTFNIGKSDKVAPTINITLATHAADKEPDKADFLAQHNQQASGSEKKVKELTTTELAKVTDVAVNKVNPLPAQAPQSIEDIQKEIIKTRGESLRKAAIQEQTNDPLRKNKALKELERADARSEKLASLQAKLDQQRQAMAKEPRVTRHTSVSAKSSDEAAYYNKWSNKIVRIGNKNFPKEALKNEIFGQLRLSVKIRADGSVASIEILESSGYAILDDAALRIVRLAAPFDPFPPEIKKKTDIFEIIRTWKFEITGLSTSA